MQRNIHLIFATIGVVVGTMRSPRSSWQEARVHGLRNFLIIRWAMAQLVANLGNLEAVKLMRLCSAVVFESTEGQGAVSHELLRWAWRYAASASHPSKGTKPAQIVAAVRSVVRDVVDQEARRAMKGVTRV